MATGDTLILFWPLHNNMPSSSRALLSHRNQHIILSFATNDVAIFKGVLPARYDGGGITIIIWYTPATDDAANVEWTTAIERMGEDITGSDLDADSFATGVNGGDQAWALHATEPFYGQLQGYPIDHDSGAEMDSLAVGEPFRLKVTRTTPSTNDHTGAMEFWGLEIQEQ